ncbi:MAG: endolytic transglycosylase MltG [Proteobacteria bacterium]|nr:endolytic transglycosylase MltG [Pseudomonadota bacterium]
MKRTIYIIIGFAIAALIIMPTYYYSLLNTPASNDAKNVTVTIKSGSSFPVITRTLVNAGVLKNDKGFKLAARIKRAHRSIKAGEYELSASMTPLEVLKAMTLGDVKYYAVTFPEGYSIKDMANTLSEAGIARADDFTQMAFNEFLVAKQGYKGKSFEGYLFPDTYKFTKAMGAAEIISMMTGKFNRVYGADKKKRATTLGLTMRELITLASIIEKETGVAEEMPLISAVFHNRLKRGIMLQSDPTTIYGIKDFNGNITKKDLRTKTPYNTYTFRGLPPGPIANPGVKAIEAALNPADVSYLYFVSRNDGTHHFSKTLKEHNRAVNKFQKRRGYN